MSFRVKSTSQGIEALRSAVNPNEEYKTTTATSGGTTTTATTTSSTTSSGATQPQSHPTTGSASGIAIRNIDTALADRM